MALELGALRSLGAYYSGYPGWKLPRSSELSIRSNSWRTNVVYGALKLFPRLARRHSRSLFLWQDGGFDRWVGRTSRIMRLYSWDAGAMFAHFSKG